MTASFAYGEARPSCLRPAFTLIELLVVVAILAALVSVLLPALSQARRHARLVRCANHQRQIVAGALAYSGSNGVFPPSICCNFCYDPIGRYWARPSYLRYFAASDCASGDGAVWPYLGPHLIVAEVFACPMSPGQPVGFPSIDFVDTDEPLDGSYSLLWNYRGFEAWSFFGPRSDSDTGEQRLPASLRLLTADRIEWNDPPGSQTWITAHPFDQALGLVQNGSAVWSRRGDGGPQPVDARMNAGYLDGHVEAFDGRDTVLLERPLPVTSYIYLPKRAVPYYPDEPPPR